MSDGAKGFSEGVKGIVGGTLKATGNELKEAGKTAVGQVKITSTNQNPSQSDQQHQQKVQQHKQADQQKIANIRSGLDMLTPTRTVQTQESRGPIAEQSFSESQQQMGALPENQKKQSIRAVDNTRMEVKSSGFKG